MTLEIISVFIPFGSIAPIIRVIAILFYNVKKWKFRIPGNMAVTHTKIMPNYLSGLTLKMLNRSGVKLMIVPQFEIISVVPQFVVRRGRRVFCDGSGLLCP
jgi:hypothetical protein